ncbi:MAG: hypothetical protein ACKVH0_19830 [Alphaproteobacteria bacterium]
MSQLTFRKYNNDWNADPNVPEPKITVTNSIVKLSFFLNSFSYDAQYGEEGHLIFKHCSLWRLGATNDHGWYAGECRYSKSAPNWGEFYELLGEDSEQFNPIDWRELSSATSEQRHFLFYFRDETFECFASDWRFERNRPLA